jgi:hypothetical protein
MVKSPRKYTNSITTQAELNGKWREVREHCFSECGTPHCVRDDQFSPELRPDLNTIRKRLMEMKHRKTEELWAVFFLYTHRDATETESPKMLLIDGKRWIV